jgi:hypothetical protein
MKRFLSPRKECHCLVSSFRLAQLGHCPFNHRRDSCAQIICTQLPKDLSCTSLQSFCRLKLSCNISITLISAMCINCTQNYLTIIELREQTKIVEDQHLALSGRWVRVELLGTDFVDQNLLVSVGCMLRVWHEIVAEDLHNHGFKD